MRDTELAGLCQILGNDCKMKVTISGEGSYIDPDNNHINIARMEATPLGKMLATGLVFHEVGHKNYTTGGGRPAGLIGQLTNIIEDVRIEQETIKARPGTRFNLDEVTTYYTDKGELEPTNLVHAICGKTMAYGRGYVLNQESIKAIEPLCDEMIDDAFGSEFAKELMDIIVHMDSLKDTDASKAMAQKIHDLVEHQKTAPPPASQGGSKGQSGGDDADNSVSSQGKVGDDDADDSNNSQGASSNGGDDDGSDISSSDSESDSQQSDGLKGGKNNAGKPTPEEIEEMLNDNGSFGDLSQMMVDEMNELSTDKSGIPLLPEIAQLKGKRPRLDEVEAISAASKMRAKMMLKLESSKRAHNTIGKSGKKISVPQLHKIALGDPRIFKRKEVVRKRNTAIVLVTDHSGSMDGERAMIANPAQFALHNALYGMPGVAVASISFQCMHNHPIRLQVGFKQKPTSDAFNITPNGTTNTDEAIWAARAMLFARPENRKIMLIITDGEPDCYDSTKAATDKCIKDGIEMAAIGIDTHSVERFWENSSCINNIKDLPKAMFEVLEKLLIH